MWVQTTRAHSHSREFAFSMSSVLFTSLLVIYNLLTGLFYVQFLFSVVKYKQMVFLTLLTWF